MFKLVRNSFFLIASLFLVLSCGPSARKLKSTEGDELEIDNNFQYDDKILETPKLETPKIVKKDPITNSPILEMNSIPVTNEKKEENQIIPDNFNLDDERIFEYIGYITNSRSTIAANGGFFNPTAVGQKIFGDRSKEIVWNNFYKVSQLRSDDQASSLEFVTGSMNTENKTAYTYTYQNYVVNPNSPAVSGTLHGIKNTKTNNITVKGHLKIEVNESTLTFYFGSSGPDTAYNIVLDNANIAQSGKLVLIYNGFEKTYDLAKITESQKLAINKLGMFKVQ